jgi:integrase
MSRKVGQIIARGNRRWLVRVYLGLKCETLKRTYHNRTIYGSLRHAQSYLTKKLHERALCRGVVSVPATVYEFLDYWLERAAKPRVREKTYKSYKDMLTRHISTILGGTKLHDLSPTEIQSAYQQLCARGLSPRTIRYTHMILHSALRQAVRWRLLPADPSDGLQLPRQPKPEIRVWTLHQVQIFLSNSLTTDYGLIFAIAITTGMRPSEYLAVFWKDINWERGTVSIVRTVQRMGGRWVFEETKRARSRRVIKLQSWILALLKKQAAERKGTGEFSEMIFPTARGKPINEHYLAKSKFKPLVRLCGLPEIRLYDLRHTAATLALSMGIPPKVVSEQLGHSKSAFTLDTYAHVLPHMQDEAAAKMEAAILSGLTLPSVTATSS